MVDIVRPSSPAELAATLGDAAQKGQRLRLGGAFSKDRMAGPLAPADLCVSTSALTEVVQYEPKDLTISVGAGMRWADLTALLDRNGQMIPLDPPFFENATVGGVLAVNGSGPRRRLYGTARDLVIGMRFATLGGKLVESGGMVVKNVAGLDMAKVMIGSFGTLAAIATVNFKLTPKPAGSRTFVLAFDTLDEALAGRRRILDDVLQPAALDLLNPAASARVGLKGYSLVIGAGGVDTTLARYESHFPERAHVPGNLADDLWTGIREFVPGFLRDFSGGAVLRVPTTITGVAEVFRKYDEPVLCRAGNGVSWVCIPDGSNLQVPAGAVAEFAPEAVRAKGELWPEPGGALALMERIKTLFDPQGILNRGRLYGRL